MPDARRPAHPLIPGTKSQEKGYQGFSAHFTVYLMHLRERANTESNRRDTVSDARNQIEDPRGEDLDILPEAAACLNVAVFSKDIARESVDYSVQNEGALL